MPQIMEEIVEVIHCDEEQIVASRATDHGRNRRSVSACAMRSRSWRLVPQIMEEIVETFSLCDEGQIVASHATDHGGNR